MPTVSVNYQNFRKGKTVTIPGLGAFSNGEVTDVDQARIDRFLRSHPHAEQNMKGNNLVFGFPVAPTTSTPSATSTTEVEEKPDDVNLEELEEEAQSD